MPARIPILILGEGQTEFYYFQSLREQLSGVTIRPDYPKHTDMAHLEQAIEDGIARGYRHILCVIDLDTKANPKEAARYAKIRRKYANQIYKKRQGIRCDVHFYESHLCTELFFLYYFAYTGRPFLDQPDLLAELRSHCPYEKKPSYCTHTHLTASGGDINRAIAQADRSLTERDRLPRDYTFTELGKLLRELPTLR